MPKRPNENEERTNIPESEWVPEPEPEPEPELVLEPEPEPEVGNLCDTCIYAYPHCGGDQAQGFLTENGIIIGCSAHQKVDVGPVETPAVATKPEPELEPEPKTMPERLVEKREIQAARLTEISD